MKSKSSLLNRSVNPIFQAIAVFALLLVFNILAYILKLSGINTGELVSWEISLTLLLCFAVGNALFFLNTKDKAKYWQRSVFSFAGFVILSIVAAQLISGISINDSGSVRWIYFVFTLGYLVFVSIAGMMRKIVEIAVKQDKRLRGEK